MDKSLFAPFLVSFLISVSFTPVVIHFFKKRGWVEDPKKIKRPNTTHKKPIPRGGGISIFLAIFATAVLFLPLDSKLKAILLAGLLTLVVGIIDDIVDLSPYPRIITNIIAALIIVNSGISIKFVTNPLGGIIDLNKNFFIFSIADLLTVIWIVWCMNIVGWSTGVAGQLPGFITITAIVIGLLSLRFSQDIAQWPVTVLAGAVSGGYLGFLPFNFYPQKMMPGYSGKSLAGFLLAVLSILSGAKLATVILTLGIPMVDGIRVIARRLYRKKMPFKGDAEHLHHLLLKAGVPQPIIAVSYWCFSAFLGAIVLQLNSKQKLWAFIMVVAGVSILIISLKRVVKKNHHSNFSA